MSSISRLPFAPADALHASSRINVALHSRRASRLDCHGGWPRQRRVASPRPAARPRWTVAAVARSQQQQEQQAEIGAVVLDVWLRVAPEEACRAIFGDDSLAGGADAAGGRRPGQPAVGLYDEHLQQGCACTELTAQPWQPDLSGGSARTLVFLKPLAQRQRLLLPFGPAAVGNREEQRLSVQQRGGASNGASDGGADTGPAITAACRCTTSGVPFSDCFTNVIQWQLLPQQQAAPLADLGSGGAPRPALQAWSGGGGGPATTRVLVTAACRFHRPLPGPLQGQIERESMQGVREVYAGFRERLLARFGNAAAPSAAAGNGQSASCLSAGGGRAAPSPAEQLSEPPAEGGLLEPSDYVAQAQQQQQQAARFGGGEQRWAAAAALARRCLAGGSAAAVLAQVEATWPAWAAAGCRPPAGAQPGAAPSPDEAAAALQAAARLASALPPHVRQQQLAKSRTVRGLVRALQLAPADPTAPRGGALRSEGGVAAALWALAVLGGSVFWEAEAETLCAMLPACRFDAPAQLAEVADVAWALAAARHHTPHLSLLERQAAALLRLQLADGGGQTPGASLPQLKRCSRLLWGLASLGHRPVLLLALLPELLGRQPAAGAAGAVDAGRRPGSAEGGGSSGSGSGPAGAVDGTARFGLLCSMGRSVAAAGCLRHVAVPALAAALAEAAEALPAAHAVSKAHLLQLHQFALALRQEVERQPGATERQPGAAGPLQQGVADSALRLQPATELQGMLGEAQQQAATGGAADAGAAAAAWRTLQQRPACRGLLAAAAAAWEAEAGSAASKTVSACQADVAATARGGLGLTVQEECAAPGLSVDIAVHSRRLAIEVDGPTHFCRNGGGPSQPRPVGGTLLKRHLLQGQGWTVVSVSTARWEKLRGAAQKRNFLAAAIAAAETAAAAEAVGG